MSVATGGAAAGVPGLPEVWQWEEQLVGFGTRYTGSSGHAAYVDWLAGQLSAVPGLRMRTDRLTFSRWLAREFALTVSDPASVGRSGPVPLTYYYPYSGQTPPGGVTGRLVDLGLYPLASGYTEAFWAPARGRDRADPGRAARVLAGSGPDGDRRLRAGPELRPGGHRLRRVRRRAGQSYLPGHIRAGSAARREERRGARRGRRLDRAARR